MSIHATFSALAQLRYISSELTLSLNSSSFLEKKLTESTVTKLILNNLDWKKSLVSFEEAAEMNCDMSVLPSIAGLISLHGDRTYDEFKRAVVNAVLASEKKDDREGKYQEYCQAFGDIVENTIWRSSVPGLVGASKMLIRSQDPIYMNYLQSNASGCAFWPFRRASTISEMIDSQHCKDSHFAVLFSFKDQSRTLVIADPDATLLESFNPPSSLGNDNIYLISKSTSISESSYPVILWRWNGEVFVDSTDETSLSALFFDYVRAEEWITEKMRKSSAMVNV